MTHPPEASPPACRPPVQRPPLQRLPDPREGDVSRALRPDARADAPATDGAAAPVRPGQNRPPPARPAGGAVSLVRPLPHWPEVPPPASPFPAAPLSAADPFPGAPPARMRRRHWGVLASFVALVLLPLAAAAWYLWFVAIDQYASRVGFSVQREETGSAVEILGGITQLAGNGTADTDILYRFIQSRALVEAVNARLDLVAIFTRPGDPLFSLPADPTIEDVEAQWARKVDVYYDPASRLIEVRALAFTPDDARRIATAVLAESTAMLNRLSAAARADATRYARAELALAEARLRAARQALTAFRAETQLVDPATDVQGRMGLLNTLLAEQAAALIDLDVLASNTGADDPRIVQAQRRVAVIENRIAAERARFGKTPADESRRYADLVGDFEALSVDLEFAQQGYLAARAAHDAALAEAQRQSRYLATWLPPTVPERADHPQRALNLAMLAGLLVGVWSILVLAAYAIRDRR